MSIAATRGHWEVVMTLVQAGADGSTVDKDGATHLSKAAETGQLGAVNALLQADADPHTTGKQVWFLPTQQGPYRQSLGGC